MVISIIFDTNVLYEKNSNIFLCFGSKQNLTKVITLIKKNEWYDNIKLFFPEVVIRELLRQKNDEFSRFKTVIGNFKNYLKAVPTEFQNFDLFYNEISEFEYNKFIQKSYKDEINNFDKRIIINELKLPSEKCFNDVIERAFNKKIPFNPEHGSSDKGFKDTLILESILENNLNNEENIVILYSDDKGFEGIEKEFSNIKIAKTEEEAKKNKNQYKTVEKLLKEVMNA